MKTLVNKGVIGFPLAEGDASFAKRNALFLGFSLF